MSEIADIVERAAAASIRWAEASPEVRAEWLRAIAAEVDAHASELVALADEETHLGSPRLPGELARTTAQLRKFADAVEEGSFLEATIDHADPGDTPPRPDLRRVLVPLGPVAVWAASNFPFAFSVLGGDTASALAAGNAVVLKVHEGHPRLSRRVAELTDRALAGAGAPEHSLQLVFTREQGIELVQHPLVQAGAFTGSIPGGRALFDLAAARPEPIPFYGELGSLNPVVITADALDERRDELADGLAASFTGGAGQFCTKPGVVFVPAGSGFADALARRVADIAPAPMLNERIREGYAHAARDVLASSSVEIVAGDATASGEVSPLVLLTSASAVAADAERVLHEVFGPATVLIEYSDTAELTAALAVVPGSLTGTVHAGEGENVAEVLRVLTPRVGRVLFEGWPTGVAVSWAQHHGGPYPATTSLFTSVGATALRRFLRPLTYQSAPHSALPAALRDENPLRLPRRIDGVLTLPAR